MSALEIIGVVLLFLVMLGAIGVIIFGLPGTWIILLSALVFAIFTDFVHITFWVIVLLLIMAATAEGIELLAVMYGAKRFGASRRATIAAVVGAIMGAILLSPLMLVIGALIGAFVGAFIGAFLVEYLVEKDLGKAASTGFGALLGKLGGTIAKAAIAVGMSAIIISDLFIWK